MKTLPTHEALGLHNPEKAFDHLINTLRDSIRFWDYFVNWDKAISKANESAKLISLWDQVINSDSPDDTVRNLIAKNPTLATTIPILAVRDGATTSVFQMATNPLDPIGSIVVYDFSGPADTKEKLENAVHFMKMSGLTEVLNTRIRGSVADYVLGVEAGLDSNGRKNRGGSAMEAAVEQHIKELCGRRGLRYMDQATDTRLAEEWGCEGTNDPGRRYDFAIDSPNGLVLVEVNFYSAGGSKLKATAGEYKELAPRLENRGHTFVWVTDGNGWHTAKAPLKSAFNEIDHVFNLDLLAEGCLVDVLDRHKAK